MKGLHTNIPTDEELETRWNMAHDQRTRICATATNDTSHTSNLTTSQEEEELKACVKRSCEILSKIATKIF